MPLRIAADASPLDSPRGNAVTVASIARGIASRGVDVCRGTRTIPARLGPRRPGTKRFARFIDLDKDTPVRGGAALTVYHHPAAP